MKHLKQKKLQKVARCFLQIFYYDNMITKKILKVIFHCLKQSETKSCKSCNIFGYFGEME